MITDDAHSGGGRVVVTGVSGFLGRHVASALAASGHEVIGICRRASHRVDGEAERLTGSILDLDFLRDALAKIAPRVVVHAAGVLGTANAGELFDLNVLGTDRLLRAACLRPPARVIIASSGAVYGASPVQPVGEEAPLAPLTAYGASKVSQEMVAVQYELDGGPSVVRARLFNLVGPGQPASAVLSHLASGVAQAEMGGDRSIPLGNGWPRRDFVDVRDAARAVALLAMCPRAEGAFNVATGRSRSIQEGCDLLANDARCPVEFKTDPLRQRAIDLDEQIGSYARIHGLTGWEPLIPFEQTLRDVLDDWRDRLSGSTT